jgi:hypothetical protein
MPPAHAGAARNNSSLREEVAFFIAIIAGELDIAALLLTLMALG